MACTGAEEAAYRVRLYPGYHAQREAMPAELREQWEKAPKLLESFGWTVGGSDELEADDVMFSYARVEEEAGGRGLLLTGDRDLYGAVTERVAVVDLGGKEQQPGEIGPAQVEERYGIRPQLVADLHRAARRPVRRPAGSAGDRCEDGSGAVAKLWLAGRGAAHSRIAGERTRQHAPAHRRRAERERRATGNVQADRNLQRIPVERPVDQAIDYAAGCRCARELGMKRLAERLEKLANGRS